MNKKTVSLKSQASDGFLIIVPRTSETAVPNKGGNYFWAPQAFKDSSGNRISSVGAYEVLDSRGNPTVAVEVRLANGVYAQAMVPSGASTGENEAIELRDSDPKRYLGKGVLQAAANVNGVIAPRLVGMPVFDQGLIDRTMIDLDGTPNKAKLGANAILGVSMAVARAAAFAAYGPTAPVYYYIGGEEARVLPVPMENSFNGGAHGEWVTDIQEFMLMPTGARSFVEAQRMVCEVYHMVAKVLKEVGYGKGLGIGNEGGYNPYLEGKFYSKYGDQLVMGVNAEVLWIFMEAVKKAGYVPGVDIHFTLDGAVSALETEPGKYTLKRDDRVLTSKEMALFYKALADSVVGPDGQQALISVEDGLSEVDWPGWAVMNQMLGGRMQLVLDDPTCTNSGLLQRGIDERSGNAILIKLNQIGSVSETIDTIELARRHNWRPVISHRSGETEDYFLADFAVGTNAGQIKTGAPQRSSRNSKYNRLFWIERQLGARAIYPGMSIFNFAEVYRGQFPG